MTFVIKPSRNRTLQLAYQLKDAADRKEKRAKKEAEPAKKAAKKGQRK